MFAAQPKLVKAWVEPEEAAFGDSINLYVGFSGSAKDLKEVYLTVREYPCTSTREGGCHSYP